MEVALLVDVQSFPPQPSNIRYFFAVDVCHLSQRVCLNDDARLNIDSMLVTLDTSHFERSALKDVVDKNMPPMSNTLDTSHFERSPLNDGAL